MSLHAHVASFPGVPAGAKLISIGDDKDIRWNVNNLEVVGTTSNLPVAVTFYGAMAFAQFYGYDLPTDAEWEQAARGPDHDDEDEHQLFPWGNVIDPGKAKYSTGNKGPVGYYDGNQSPFGPDMKNDYGLYDMAGNLWEWCRSKDLSSVEDYPQLESLTHDLNAISYLVSGARALRGGAYNSQGSEGGELHCNNRYWYDATQYTVSFGFRVIRRETDYTDPWPEVEISESFDGGGWIQRLGFHDWSITAPSGDWRGNGGYTEVHRDDTSARSGTGVILFNQNYSYLYLPTTAGLPVGVSVWARKRSSTDSSGRVYAQVLNGITWSQTGSVSVSSIEYEKVDLAIGYSAPDGQAIRLYCDKVYLDDLKIYTIPR
jgi:hypothetical protein